MPLGPAEVEKVARLGRLILAPDELARMTEQLGQIVAYVEQLAELPLGGVEPMAHAADLANVLADDVVAPSLAREAALANAPKQDGACFLAPAVLGE